MRYATALEGNRNDLESFASNATTVTDSTPMMEKVIVGMLQLQRVSDQGLTVELHIPDSCRFVRN